MTQHAVHVTSYFHEIYIVVHEMAARYNCNDIRNVAQNLFN